jgi:putative oxidoreductase
VTDPITPPAPPSAAELGAALLRVALGLMFLAHSVVLKLLVFGLPGTAAYFASLGRPPALAHVVFAAEAIGGLLLVLGVQARWVALALLPILAGATWTHAGNGWVFTATGGGWEYPFLLTVLALVQALLGDGAFALAPSRALPGAFARPAGHAG